MKDGSSDERVKRGHLMVNGTLAAEASLLGKVLMTSADHIYMFDPSGRYLFANAAGAAALGLKPADMMGRHWRELGFPRDIMETFADNLRRVMETRRPLTAYTDFPTLEGVRRYEYILTPVVSPSGEVEAVVCDARDMTALPGEGVSEREGDGEEGMRALSLQLMEIQEAERRKIARELHDQVGQTLSIIKVNLQQLSRCPDLETQQALLDRTIAALGQVLDQIRRISHDLRPSILDDLGLAAALRWFVDYRMRDAGIETRFSAVTTGKRLPPDVETACFRVVQEALTNVIKHSGARRCKVSLNQAPRRLVLTVEDDGVGFDLLDARTKAVRGGHLGLLGMQERIVSAGGAFHVEAAAGKGCRLEIVFDFQEKAVGEGGEDLETS